MVFLWVVPVVAATVGVGILLGRVRALEDLSVDLMMAIHRTRELRSPLAAVRDEMAHSGPLFDRVWAHWEESQVDGPSDDHRGSEERTSPGS